MLTILRTRNMGILPTKQHPHERLRSLERPINPRSIPTLQWSTRCRRHDGLTGKYEVSDHRGTLITSRRILIALVFQMLLNIRKSDLQEQNEQKPIEIKPPNIHKSIKCRSTAITKQVKIRRVFQLYSTAVALHRIRKTVTPPFTSLQLLPSPTPPLTLLPPSLWPPVRLPPLLL